eukprot:gnl/TRDRNA2_/TRDRNA2_130857_c0_seq1.p1 gnl/TRDRNA2_/TRDRNA2_130857_c0~~gnl/TRDRNA2_/TRDRNA2_130857_c0_seq1.p1  ORF type:complete len:1172 (-),score=217.81 gnl/TRDRNA2_/TRDRNA2_130857_c0_seq1:58-3573(-)
MDADGASALTGADGTKRRSEERTSAVSSSTLKREISNAQGRRTRVLSEALVQASCNLQANEAAQVAKKTHPGGRDDEQLERLAHVVLTKKSLFSDFSVSVVQDMCQNFEYRMASAHTILFRENDPATNLFVVLNGRVSLAYTRRRRRSLQNDEADAVSITVEDASIAHHGRSGAAGENALSKTHTKKPEHVRRWQHAKLSAVSAVRLSMLSKKGRHSKSPRSDFSRQVSSASSGMSVLHEDDAEKQPPRPKTFQRQESPQSAASACDDMKVLEHSLDLPLADVLRLYAENDQKDRVSKNEPGQKTYGNAFIAFSERVESRSKSDHNHGLKIKIQEIEESFEDAEEEEIPAISPRRRGCVKFASLFAQQSEEESEDNEETQVTHPGAAEVREMRAGDVLGAKACLHDLPHDSTATTLEACELLVLSKEQLQELASNELMSRRASRAKALLDAIPALRALDRDKVDRLVHCFQSRRHRRGTVLCTEGETRVPNAPDGRLQVILSGHARAVKGSGKVPGGDFEAETLCHGRIINGTSQLLGLPEPFTVVVESAEAAVTSVLVSDLASKGGLAIMESLRMSAEGLNKWRETRISEVQDAVGRRKQIFRKTPEGDSEYMERLEGTSSFQVLVGKFADEVRKWNESNLPSNHHDHAAAEAKPTLTASKSPCEVPSATPTPPCVLRRNPLRDGLPRKSSSRPTSRILPPEPEVKPVMHHKRDEIRDEMDVEEPQPERAATALGIHSAGSRLLQETEAHRRRHFLAGHHVGPAVRPVSPLDSIGSGDMVWWPGELLETSRIVMHGDHGGVLNIGHIDPIRIESSSPMLQEAPGIIGALPSTMLLLSRGTGASTNEPFDVDIDPEDLVCSGDNRCSTSAAFSDSPAGRLDMPHCSTSATISTPGADSSRAKTPGVRRWRGSLECDRNAATGSRRPGGRRRSSLEQLQGTSPTGEPPKAVQLQDEPLVVMPEAHAVVPAQRRRSSGFRRTPRLPLQSDLENLSIAFDLMCQDASAHSRSMLSASQSHVVDAPGVNSVDIGNISTMVDENSMWDQLRSMNAESWSMSLNVESMLGNFEASYNESHKSKVDQVDTFARDQRPMRPMARRYEEGRQCVPPGKLLDDNVFAVQSIDRYLDKSPRHGAVWTGSKEMPRLPETIKRPPCTGGVLPKSNIKTRRVFRP